MSVTLTDAPATTPMQRIRAAIEHTKPDAPRVTVRRDDAQTLVSVAENWMRQTDGRLTELAHAREHASQAKRDLDFAYNDLDAERQALRACRKSLADETLIRAATEAAIDRARGAADFWRIFGVTVFALWSIASVALVIAYRAGWTP